MGQIKNIKLHIVTDIKCLIKIPRMTKLMQWLLVACIYGSLYCAVLGDVLPVQLTHNARMGVVISPVILVILFGVYSVVTILYRVATFNDCEDAAAELKEQIRMAKEDLTSKGMKFD